MSAAQGAGPARKQLPLLTVQQTDAIHKRIHVFISAAGEGGGGGRKWV
jgi:hypothetical protein